MRYCAIHLPRLLPAGLAKQSLDALFIFLALMALLTSGLLELSRRGGRLPLFEQNSRDNSLRLGYRFSR